MTIREFTEIKAWQMAREIAKDVYALAGRGLLSKDYGLKDQMQRAAVSIGSNIAEGFERDSNAEFVKFLGYAKGSAGELLSQLITANDVGYLQGPDLERMTEKIKMTSRMIARFRDALSESPVKGGRWKAPKPETRNPKLRNPET